MQARIFAELKRVALVLALLLVTSSNAFCEEIWDPLEPMNRGIFWFNNKVDVNLIEPVARTYRDNVGDATREGIGNFFTNLRYPRYLVSDIIQLKFGQAADHTGRFLINSTIGLLGFFDVATEMGIEDNYEDIGLALAYHGVPHGPFLMLPLLGPSSLRDTVGTVADTFLEPWAILSYTGTDIDWEVVLGFQVVRAIDQRADLIEAIEAARESSVDFYLFIQSAYFQHRRGVLYDGSPPDEEFEDFEELAEY